MQLFTADSLKCIPSKRYPEVGSGISTRGPLAVDEGFIIAPRILILITELEIVTGLFLALTLTISQSKPNVLLVTRRLSLSSLE